MDILVSALQRAEREVEQTGEGEGNFEANVTCFQANRTHEPYLVHAGNDKGKRKHACGKGSRSPWKTPGNIPIRMIISTEVASPEIEVFDEQDATICARPVADQTKEVRERCIELVGADDCQR